MVINFSLGRCARSEQWWQQAPPPTPSSPRPWREGFRQGRWHKGDNRWGGMGAKMGLQQWRQRIWCPSENPTINFTTITMVVRGDGAAANSDRGNSNKIGLHLRQPQMWQQVVRRRQQTRRQSKNWPLVNWQPVGLIGGSWQRKISPHRNACW
jgi:hypothetical protein